MVESVVEARMDSGKPENEPDFPEEWISIAAYYIWKSDGQQDGRDDDRYPHRAFATSSSTNAGRC